MKKELVLVTGGTGFIAVHIILQLLNQGYRVRTTLRTMSRQKEVKGMLTQGGVKILGDLEFVQADLTSDDHWLEAASGAILCYSRSLAYTGNAARRWSSHGKNGGGWCDPSYDCCKKSRGQKSRLNLGLWCRHRWS